MQALRVARRHLLLLMPTLISGSAFAAGLETTVAQCQAIEDRQARLACFDALPRAVTRVAVPSAPAPVERQKPGQGETAATEPAAVAKTSEIIRISKAIDNRQILYLEDGTVWQESRNGSRRFQAGQRASIAQSQVLGSETIVSYWMEIDSAKFKVVQLR